MKTLRTLMLKLTFDNQLEEGKKAIYYMHE